MRKENKFLKPKIRLMRVLTDSRSVPWHLGKTLKALSGDFEVFVVGDRVSEHSADYPNVTFTDVQIKTKVNLYKDFIALLKLALVVHRFKPHIIHSIMPKASLLSAIASYMFVPVRIHTFTGQVWQTMAGPKRVFFKMMDRVVVNLNTICFTDSTSQSKFLMDEGIGYKGVPLPVISKGSLGGVDLSKICIAKKNKWRRNIRRQHLIDNDDFVIGYLARKTADKGALLLLDVFSRLSIDYPHVVLMFIGPDDSGEELAFYKSEKPKWNRRVIDIGLVENHEEYLAAFDILCLPSFREGFGSIVIDAAALAVPTVGSRIPGLVDAVDELSSGLLFAAGDANDLYEKLSLVLNDPALVAMYGTNAYQRVLKYYDSAFVTKEIEGRYKELLSAAGVYLFDGAKS